MHLSQVTEGRTNLTEITLHSIGRPRKYSSHNHRFLTFFLLTPPALLAGFLAPLPLATIPTTSSPLGDDVLLAWPSESETSSVLPSLLESCFFSEDGNLKKPPKVVRKAILTSEINQVLKIDGLVALDASTGCRSPFDSS